MSGALLAAGRLRKTPKRGKVELREVWAVNGDHCSFCGKTWALCERLRIGRSAQHVVPFYAGGDDWPLIPFCARCQEMSAAALRETRDVTRLIEELDGSSAAPEAAA